MSHKKVIQDYEVVDEYLSDDEESHVSKPVPHNPHDHSTAPFNRNSLDSNPNSNNTSTNNNNNNIARPSANLSDQHDLDASDDQINSQSQDDIDDTQVLHKDISKIYTIVFSQTGKTVAIGTEDGLRIQSTETKNNKHARKHVVEKQANPFNSGVKVVSLLYDTFLCALVTDNKNRKFPDSKVYVWDQINREVVGEYDFYSTVTALTYMRELLLVASEKRLVLYDIVQKKPLKYILDVVNPSKFTGSTVYDSFTYAYTPDNKGTIIVTNVWYNNPIAIDFNQEIGLNSAGNIDNSRIVGISNMVLSPDGKWLAASEKGGNIVKIFDTQHGKIKCTLYRGQRPKIITDMQFSKDSSVFGLISTNDSQALDDGTIHIYDLGFLANGKAISASDKLKDIRSLQFHFDILKRQSYASKETRLSGPLIQFDPSGVQAFTIYSDSDYTISQAFDVKSDEPKKRLNDNLKLDGWIDPIQDQL